MGAVGGDSWGQRQGQSAALAGVRRCCTFSNLRLGGHCPQESQERWTVSSRS